jgi:hypothetical protein
VVVDIVGKRQSIPRADVFKGDDMSPTGLLFGDIGVKQVSAVIVKACNEVELFGDIRGPSVVGGVMLD